eukprot:TRINITY_DN7950_c2_g1_i1.p1 TRINITY_DN7950_c2_g1~~TRINITY_DN7950_c2_g1_i1.p1  ORF type:complete len:588 (+),score=187.23 TRINITY_DN7950_c2_g1_i1:165-1928(+)
MPRMMDGGFWKGTPQTRWRYYTLLAAAAALFLAGVVLLGIDALVAVDAMASPFSDAVHAWWSLAGFAVGPDAWLGFALVAHGALCLAAAEYRVVLNALTVACLLMAGYFCMINVSAMLVGSGRFDRDVQVLWAHADTRGVCRFQLATGCSGLMALCPTDFPVQPRHAAAHTAAPVQQPAANASTHAPAAARSGHPQALRNLLFLEAPLAGLDAPECRNCSAYNPKGWDWGLDDGDTCLTPIHTQAARVVVPFTGAVALLFCALSGVCLVSAQPLGLAFALTTVMLAAMVYAFSAWQTLFNPAQQDVREWQRGVAIAANFVAMQLATISIAGLHWKPHLPAALKQNITLVLFLVPVIGTASSFALLMPAAEAFFALVREVYCTLLLVVLVRIWDETAETVPVIAVDDASHRAAESVRAAKRRWVNVLCLVKIAAVDLNGFVFESYYPPAALTLLVWAGVVLFSVILYVIHEIFKYLPSLREAGELQFFSIKAIVSFIFFDFAVLKVLHYEGFQSVIVGELYVSVALVGLAIFQLYTWLIAPLHVLPAAAPDAALLADTHSPQGSAGRSSSRSGYGTMEMRIGVPSARK